MYRFNLPCQEGTHPWNRKYCKSIPNKYAISVTIANSANYLMKALLAIKVHTQG